MTDRGRLRDTYVAAVQHDLVDRSPDDRLVGVVRRPLPWFRGQVDENRRALAPPAGLLDEFKARTEALEREGLSDAAAHNRAWDDVDFEERYRRHLDRDTEARDAVADLAERLDRGEDLVLVCYENTDEKRCHRTILAELLDG